ncbi:MAG: FAD-binding oxidoreductase [Cyanobacteria bacterium P01_H01_bin.15]
MPATQASATVPKLEPLTANWQQKVAAFNGTDTLTEICYPSSISELQSAITNAAQTKTPVMATGNGTKLDWGGLPENPRQLICTQNLDRLIEHARNDLTVTAEAGLKLGDLQAQLVEAGQFLPLNPSYAQKATLGGVVATADTGSWRHRYGGVRDLLLGIEFVRADGELAKAGGRVVKNVAGYDLMKLHTGAYGTLGVIATLTFRTYPLPEASETLVITGEIEFLMTLLKTLRNSSLTPTVVDFLSASALKRCELGKSSAGILIRFQTIPESIVQQRKQLAIWSKELSLTLSTLEPEQAQQFWLNYSVCTREDSNILLKVGVLPSTIATVLTTWQTLTDNHGWSLFHGGSGIGYLGINTSQARSHWLLEMREQCKQECGYLTPLRAPIPWKQQANDVDLLPTAKSAQLIKQQFDPDNLFSPGRM